ncbi:tyrosine-type recombinase/integrase [Bradyrhizobium sp. USDA 4469]
MNRFYTDTTTSILGTVPSRCGALAAATTRFVPVIVQRSGERSIVRFIEFFVVDINNKNTRDAYFFACCRFLSWCDSQRVIDICCIEPLHVAVYLKTLQDFYGKPTIKQHLAAIRALFNWLLVGQVVKANPAISVKGPKYDMTRGLTPVLTGAEVSRLISGIDLSTQVGLRDRALVGLMVFSFARISAALMMTVNDYFIARGCRRLRLKEKGGRVHEMPVHPILERYLDSYLTALPTSGSKSPTLFRASGSPTNLLSRAMTRTEAYRMVRRRAQDCGIEQEVCCHSFRATGITIYLENGGTLEYAQTMAGHRRLQTTKLYDRRNDAITMMEVERITIG